MPQIGWFEILIIVVLAIVVIGPKDFPIVLKKIGNWMGSIKRYFNDIQKDITEVEDSVEEGISLEENFLNKNKDIKKDE
jgi:sec-independent protein translocase protein TatB